VQHFAVKAPSKPISWKNALVQQQGISLFWAWAGFLKLSVIIHAHDFI
jgi:hypothetical protein